MTRLRLTAVLILILLSAGLVHGQVLYETDWEGYSHPGNADGWSWNEAVGGAGPPYWDYEGNLWDLDPIQCAGEGYESTCALMLTVPSGEEESEYDPRSFTETSGVIYNRFYYKVSDPYDWSGTENKVMYLNWQADDGWRANISTQTWQECCAADDLGYEVGCAGGSCVNGQSPGRGDGMLSINVSWSGITGGKHDFFQNIPPYDDLDYRFIPAVDTWYCIEWAVTPNTPSASDGRLELWVDDVKLLDHQNVNVRNTNTSDFQRIFITSYHNDAAPYAIGTYYDDIVISTEPIGCGAASPGEPAVITGVSFSGVSREQ